MSRLETEKFSMVIVQMVDKNPAFRRCSPCRWMLQGERFAANRIHIKSIWMQREKVWSSASGLFGLFLLGLGFF